MGDVGEIGIGEETGAVVGVEGEGVDELVIEAVVVFGGDFFHRLALETEHLGSDVGSDDETITHVVGIVGDVATAPTALKGSLLTFEGGLVVLCLDGLCGEILETVGIGVFPYFLLDVVVDAEIVDGLIDAGETGALFDFHLLLGGDTVAERGCCLLHVVLGLVDLGSPLELLKIELHIAGDGSAVASGEELGNEVGMDLLDGVEGGHDIWD